MNNPYFEAVFFTGRSFCTAVPLFVVAAERFRQDGRGGSGDQQPVPLFPQPEDHHGGAQQRRAQRPLRKDHGKVSTTSFFFLYFSFRHFCKEVHGGGRAHVSHALAVREDGALSPQDLPPINKIVREDHGTVSKIAGRGDFNVFRPFRHEAGEGGVLM